MRKHEEDYKVWFGDKKPPDIDEIIQDEAMFDSFKLREVWEYYVHHGGDLDNTVMFFVYLLRLCKDIPLDQQKYQP